MKRRWQKSEDNPTMLSKDPTRQTEHKLTVLLKNSGISAEDLDLLCPHSSKPSRLYGLRKIHKISPLIE